MRFWVGVVLLSISGAVPASVTGPKPAGRVTGAAVSHPGGPGLTVTVPPSAVYAGSRRFTLYDVADAEIHVFVDADAQKRVRKLYWVQFESYLPARADHRYEYGANDLRSHAWGAPIWVRTFLSRTERPPRIGSDSEAVRSIVAQAGYRLPSQLMMARLVRLLDDLQGTGYGRSELMLIYAEDLAPSGLTIEDLTTADGESNAKWPPLEAPLIARATAAFSIKPTQRASSAP